MTKDPTRFREIRSAVMLSNRVGYTLAWEDGGLPTMMQSKPQQAVPQGRAYF